MFYWTHLGTCSARFQTTSCFVIFFHFLFTEFCCLIYLQVLLLKVSVFSSILHGRMGLKWFSSSAGVGARTFDNFALFHFCQQLKKYILRVLWQAFIAPGLKSFRGVFASKCCFHNSKTKYSPFSLFLLFCSTKSNKI